MAKQEKQVIYNTKTREPRPLSPTDTTRTLGIKCYEEQLVYGFDSTLRKIRNISSSECEIYAMIHDKGEKKHLHIALRLKNKPAKVSSLLKSLGVHFRDEDSLLLLNRGLETVGNFTGYAIYLTHRDKASVKAGKEVYEVSNFITNMDRASFSMLIEGKLPKKKMSETEKYHQYCLEAKQAGYDLWNYNSWFSKMEDEFISYSDGKMHYIRQSFRTGMDKRLNELGTVQRINICINLCNSRSLTLSDLNNIVRNALHDMNIILMGYQKKASSNTALIYKCKIEYINVNNQGFSPYPSQFITIEENGIKRQDLNTCEGLNYPNHIVKFQNDSVFAGKYVITITNCPNDVFNAEDKPYYYCVIDDNNELKCLDVCRRDSAKIQNIRKELYKDFRDHFNKRLKNYSLSQNTNQPAVEETVDYSDIL